MERTPGGGFSQPSTFTSATHFFTSTQAPVVVGNSPFEGTPTTPRPNITLSSHSTTHQFELLSSSSSTSLEPCTARSNQTLAPFSSRTSATSIQPAFLPFDSVIPTLQAPFCVSLGNTPYGLGTSIPVYLSRKQNPTLVPFRPPLWFKSFVSDCSSRAATSSASVPSTSLPSRSSTHGSLSCSVESSQPIELSQNSPPFHDGQPQSHSIPPQCAVSPVMTAPSHLSMNGETFGGHALNIILNPPDIPLYDPLFLQWLQARRAWMISQGRGDPSLFDPSLLAQMFDKWLRQWWPLFHFLRLGAPGINPSGWIGIFDFWFITLPYEHFPSPFLSQTTPANTITTPTASDQAPEVAVASLSSASLATGSMKHYWNEESTLTVQQIQDACTGAGGDPYAIQRLAVVFPPGSVVTRDALKVGRKPRVGHHGYQEFSVLSDGRWYCLLCRMTGERSWKNQKDILNHVWNDHCDPPSLG